MLSGTRHTQINVPVKTSDVPSTLAINPNGKPIVAAAVGYQAKAGEQLYWGSRRGLSRLITLRLDSLSRAHVTTAIRSPSSTPGATDRSPVGRRSGRPSALASRKRRAFGIADSASDDDLPGESLLARVVLDRHWVAGFDR